MRQAEKSVVPGVECRCEVGDVVFLKSGSPPMTVVSFTKKYGYRAVVCEWQAGMYTERGEFTLMCLVRKAPGQAA